MFLAAATYPPRALLAGTPALGVATFFRVGRATPCRLLLGQRRLPTPSQPRRAFFATATPSGDSKSTASGNSTQPTFQIFPPELKQEMAKSYFWELQELKKDPAAKHFQAQEVKPPAPFQLPGLLKASQSFLDLDGKAVDPKQVASIFERHQATLFVVSMQRVHSYHSMIRTWEEPFVQRYRDNPDVGIVELVLVEKRLHAFFNFVYRRATKNSMSLPEVRPNIFYLTTPAPTLRNLLGIRNSFVGYAFLVDQQQEVRWRGVGEASPKELEGLYEIVDRLLSRSQKAQERTPKP